jgi:heat shock protein HslJ
MRSEWGSLLVLGVVALMAAPIVLGQDMTDLMGTEWQLVSIAGEDVAAGVTTTLTFGEDGRAGGSGGCNRYSANYVIDRESLGFGPVVSTKMACPEPNMQQEAAYFAALEAVVSYSIQQGQLVVTAADGLTLVFIPATLHAGAGAGPADRADNRQQARRHVCS